MNKCIRNKNLPFLKWLVKNVVGKDNVRWSKLTMRKFACGLMLKWKTKKTPQRRLRCNNGRINIYFKTFFFQNEMENVALNATRMVSINID